MTDLGQDNNTRTAVVRLFFLFSRVWSGVRVCIKKKKKIRACVASPSAAEHQ